MNPQVEAVLDRLEQATVRLQQVLSTHHGYYRGTYDSVLAEVQEGVMLQARGGGTAISHLSSLTEGVTAATRANAAATDALRELGRLDHRAADELSDALAPLLRLARNKIDLGERTLDLVRELQILHPGRLTGVPLQTRGRTVGALTTTQLGNLGVAAVPAGVAADPRAAALLRDISRQPLDAAGLADEVAAANRAVRAALVRRLGHATTTAGTRRFAGNLSARFSPSGHLGTAAGTPGTGTGGAALRREAVGRRAAGRLADAADEVERRLAAGGTGDAARRALRGRLARVFGRRAVQIAESRLARRALSLAPVVGWGFSAADAWAGGRDVLRGNVGRGLAGISLAVGDVAADFLHLGDAVSGVGGTVLSLAAQGGSIAGQVAIEMDRVQENMDRVLAEVDRTGTLPSDARLRDEFELDADTIRELRAAVAG